MPLTANKTFQLTEDRAFTRGQVIPADVWDDLRPRTQNALLGARFVIRTDDTAPAKPAGQKRGK